MRFRPAVLLSLPLLAIGAVVATPKAKPETGTKPQAKSKPRPIAFITRTEAPVPAPPAGVDYGGRPFVTQTAPRLRFERRLAPRLEGIDYPFAEQTARGVALFDRFPPFTLSDRRIHLSGPWYDSAAANTHFTHGITSVEPMPNYRLDGAKYSVRDVPAAHKWFLMTDPLFRDHAVRLANELEAVDAKDPRIAPLRTFAIDHKFSDHEGAFVALGRHVWESERFPADTKGEGMLYPCIDIEQTGGWEFQRNCFGWLYKGMAQAAKEKNLTIIPQTYGQWTFEVGAVHFSMKQGGVGDPEYLLPEKDFLGSPDPTLNIVNELGGVIAMDGYMQAIWGNEPFYKRNADGSLLMQNEAPVWNDISKTMAYGQEVPLEAGEAQHCLSDLYRQAVRMYLMHHRFAGQYPERSDMKKPFLANSRISAWTRITNEGLQGIQANDRPLPPWLLETLTGMYLFSADDYVVWSSDTNTPSGPLGADYTKAWNYNAHGTFEHIVKGAHRYSALDPLHADQSTFTWLWFKLPMVNKNETPGERPYQKPIVWGKVRTFENQPWLELFAAFPALDNQATDMKIWIDKDGQRSSAYTVRLKNGRTYFTDAWQLPAQFKNLQGKDIYLRFTDAAGKVRTWRGDWRAAVDETVTTPADYKGRVL